MKKQGRIIFLDVFLALILIFILILPLSSCKTEILLPSSSSMESSPISSSEKEESSSSQSGPMSYEPIETDLAVYNFEKGYLNEEKRIEFTVLCDQGILDAKEYLGEYVKNNNKITYFIESDIAKASMTFVDGSIELHGVEQELAEYVHETVHSLLGYHNPVWIDEGIATYIDTKFTAWKNPPAYGEDINQLSHNYMFVEGLIHIERLSDEIMISKDRFRAYIAAASLVEYIETNFSKDTLLKLHSDFENADLILGRDFFSVKGEWLEHIEVDY